VGADEEFEKSVTAERLLQLQQASTFFLHLVHKVHTLKKEAKADLESGSGAFNLAEALDKLVKKETMVKKGGRRASSAASDDFNRSQAYMKQQEAKKRAAEEKEEKEVKEKKVEGLAVKEAKVFGAADLKIPYVPQLFPDVGTGDKAKEDKHIWHEPVDLLIAVAEIVFDEVKSFSENDVGAVAMLKDSLFGQIYNGANGGLVEVDEWAWHCMQFWAGIVRLRIYSLRRMTQWFGDRAGGKMLAKAMHSLDDWKVFCMKKLPLSSKNFHKILEVRDQNEFFFESFHQTLLKAEQNFPMFSKGQKLNFGKVIRAFEEGVMPTITLDIGGAKEMLQPLELVSDLVSKQAKERQKRVEEEKKKEKEKLGQLERGGSYAERARATQRAKLGIAEEKKVEEVVEEWEVYESFKGAFLVDSFETYACVIRGWIASVEKGEVILSGEFDGEDVRIGRLKEDLDGVEEEVERVKGWEAPGGDCTRDEHKMKRVALSKATERWRSAMGAFHKLMAGDKVGGKEGVTAEFAKDDWVKGRRVDVRGRNKVKSWLK